MVVNEDFNLRNIFSGGLSSRTTREGVAELFRERKQDIEGAKKNLDELEEYHKEELKSASNN